MGRYIHIHHMPFIAVLFIFVCVLVEAHPDTFLQSSSLVAGRPGRVVEIARWHPPLRSCSLRPREVRLSHLFFEKDTEPYARVRDAEACRMAKAGAKRGWG